MSRPNAARSGRHFLQIPGPSNVPDRVLRAIGRPVIDHRGPEFATMTRRIFDKLAPVFGTSNPVVLYPSSGTGAWEAALVNTLSPGDRVAVFVRGQFATLWRNMAEKLGLQVEAIEGDWRRPVDPAEIEALLAKDRKHAIKAVMVVHSETATGVANPIADIRAAIDRAGHPALFMVDTVSAVGAMEYRHDDWRVDVSVAGSQKGLMLPPGIGFNAVSDKALEAHKTAGLPRAYWDWGNILNANKAGSYPYTPPINLMFGLEAALDMLLDEGLENVFARHMRFGEAVRRAAGAWGLEVFCLDPDACSGTVTALQVPEGHDADALRKIILERFDMSLGVGLGPLAGKVFRVGHLGDLNDLTIAGTLSGIEMGLSLSGIPYEMGGVATALAFLAETSGGA